MSRLIEIPDDGIIRTPIIRGGDNIGERNIDLSDFPVVDAVPVTRCVECNYSSMEGWYCNGCGIMPAHPTFPNEYCSKGRMTNNGLL